MHVTIERVAKQAGVSRALASSVLSGGIPQIRYSEETRKKVQKAAKALNYKPKEVHGVGLIHSLGPMTPQESSWVHWLGPMLESIHEEAVSDNKLVSVFGCSSSQIGRMFKGPNGPQILKRRKVDGLIVSGVFDEKLTDQIALLGLPYVLMNVDNSDIHDTDSVFFDDAFAGRQATEYLVKRGHQRILHVSPRRVHEHYSVPHRRSGYEKAMADAGLEPQVLFEEIPENPERENLLTPRLRQLLEGQDPPTAIFAYDEIVTIGCHHVLEGMNLNRNNVNLVTVGTNYTHLMRLWRIPQVAMPSRELGRQAYRMLMEKQETGRSLPSVALRGQIEEYQRGS